MRNRNARWLLATALLALLAAAPVAVACSCLEPGPPAESLEQADAVFCGKVASVEETVREESYGHLPRNRVEVTLGSVWKGIPEGETVTLWTGLGGGDCGYHFVAGEEYMVYAYEADNGSLSTGICSRTRPLADADEDLEALGEPRRKSGEDCVARAE